MKNHNPILDNFSQLVDVIVRLAAVVALVFWSFKILEPFLLIIVWGAILAIACQPIFEKLSHWLHDRRGVAAVLTSFGLVVLILLPSYFLGDSLVTGFGLVKEHWAEGKIKIPAPTEEIREFPVIGEKIYRFWTSAHANLQNVLEPLAPRLRSLGAWMLERIAETGFVLLQFILSIVVAGVLLAHWKSFAAGMRAFSVRLVAGRGGEFFDDVVLTVRSVTKGILGVAFIQAILAGAGMAVAGIPGAGLWSLVALVLAIIQIGVSPVLIVAALYLFSTASTLKASLFLVWALFVAPLDNILKPLLLGRGSSVPMLVIFLGALGGFLRSGLIGLFVGAVILSLAYKLLRAWLAKEQCNDEQISKLDSEN